MENYKRTEMAKEQGEQGEIVLFDRFTEKTHFLNKTATIIYNMCEEATVEEMVDALLEDVVEQPPVDEVKKDIKSILETFISHGIVVEV